MENVGKMRYDPPIKKPFFEALWENNIPVADINVIQGTGRWNYGVVAS